MQTGLEHYYGLEHERLQTVPWPLADCFHPGGAEQERDGGYVLPCHLDDRVPWTSLLLGAARAGVTCPITIIGDSVLPQDLTAEQQGVLDRISELRRRYKPCKGRLLDVRFAGRRSRESVAAEYRAARAVLVPCPGAPFARVIEAIACGAPVFTAQRLPSKFHVQTAPGPMECPLTEFSVRRVTDPCQAAEWESCFKPPGDADGQPIPVDKSKVRPELSNAMRHAHSEARFDSELLDCYRGVLPDFEKAEKAGRTKMEDWAKEKAQAKSEADRLESEARQKKDQTEVERRVKEEWKQEVLGLLEKLKAPLEEAAPIIYSRFVKKAKPEESSHEDGAGSQSTGQLLQPLPAPEAPALLALIRKLAENVAWPWFDSITDEERKEKAPLGAFLKGCKDQKAAKDALNDYLQKTVGLGSIKGRRWSERYLGLVKETKALPDLPEGFHSAGRPRSENLWPQLLALVIGEDGN